MNHATRAVCYTRHASILTVRRCCRNAARAPTAFLKFRTLGQPLGRCRLLLSGCGFGVAGLLVVQNRHGAIMCEVAEASSATSSAVDRPHVEEGLEVATSGSHRVHKLPKKRKRSWTRWFQMLWRCGTLLCKFGPLVVVTPLLVVFWRHGGEGVFWRLLLSALDSAGPTFVKLAQWASTRPDLLPITATTHLARLQAGTQPHTYQQTSQVLAEAFGPDWVQKIQIDDVPVGSGCIGQVYHGWLLGQGIGSEDQEIAVKVRHPGAKEKVHLDLEIMRYVAQSLESAWRRLSLLSISEFVDHFEAFILPQADMRVEASNLEVFKRNFTFESTGRGLPVQFPSVIRPYVSEAALVMTYERAIPMTQLLQDPSERDIRTADNYQLFRCPSRISSPILKSKSTWTSACRRVGKICLDSFLQMMFHDQFVHGDLHPGNMMVRLGEDGTDPVLVVIDTGLAVQLGPRDHRNFVDVLHAVALKDGPRVGRLMVERTPGDRRAVIDEEIFVQRVADLVHKARGKGMSLGKFGIGDILAQMLQLAYYHRVKLETSFVTVVTSIIVLEGVSRQLDPTTDVIEAATPFLVKAAAARAFSGR